MLVTHFQLDSHASKPLATGHINLPLRLILLTGVARATSPSTASTVPPHAQALARKAPVARRLDGTSLRRPY